MGLLLGCFNCLPIIIFHKWLKRVICFQTEGGSVMRVEMLRLLITNGNLLANGFSSGWVKGNIKLYTSLDKRVRHIK